MERLISIGERLQKLLDEAESEAEVKIAEAQKMADEIVAQAKSEAENRRIRAQRGDGIEDFIVAEEEKANKEASKILEDYQRRAEVVKDVETERFEKAMSIVMGEVLPE
jgi:F0F1-type ATP synthase membrane subunit b/b'